MFDFTYNSIYEPTSPITDEVTDGEDGDEIKDKPQGEVLQDL